MNSGEHKLTPKVRACKENGSLGGFKTAANHTQEWLEERARKGGDALVTRYSTDYYRWINGQRRTKRGWPLGKLRNKVMPVLEQLSQERKDGVLDEAVIGALEGMLQSVSR